MTARPASLHTHPHGGSGGPGLFQQVRKFHPGSACRQSATGTTRANARAWKPARPSSSTCSDSRVRQPAVRPSVHRDWLGGRHRCA